MYLHALVARARVLAAAAGLLARDGHDREALHLVNEVASHLRSDCFELLRRLRALAVHEPPRKLLKSTPRPHHQVAQDLWELIERQISPLIPAAATEEIQLPLPRELLEFEPSAGWAS